MDFPRVLGRFFGPYGVFAALSGLSAGFFLGAVVSVIALVAAVVTLVGGIAGGTALGAAAETVKAFPEFAFFVLAAVAWGFVSGFFAALIAALVGGLAGFWWAFAVVFGGICFVYPLYAQNSFGRDPSIPMALVMSVCGVLFPLLYLGSDAAKLPFSAFIHPYLSQSWLVETPQSARIAGIVLPFLLYGSWEIQTVAPEFAQHQNYAARLGNWTTWRESKRLVMSQLFRRRSYCQSNLKQIGLGLAQYLQDYDEIYPPLPQSAEGGAGAILQPYLKSTQIFQCPQELYRPENLVFSSGDFSDYWFNARFYDLNAAKLSFSSNCILWGDGNTGAGEATAAYALKSLPPNWAPSLRHGGGANYAFADGHVKWIKPRAISNSATPSSATFTMIP